MKKLYGILAALALMVVALPSNAAITFDKASPQPTNNEVTVSCTGYFGVYRSTTKQEINTGTCNNALDADTPGTYTVLESATSQEGDGYYAVTSTDSESYQVTPDFSGSTTYGSITNASFTDFLAGIGDYLTENLPLVLAVLAALIGLGFLIRRVMRWIGRKA